MIIFGYKDKIFEEVYPFFLIDTYFRYSENRQKGDI